VTEQGDTVVLCFSDDGPENGRSRQRSPAVSFFALTWCLCVQCQAAAVSVLLSFLRLCILAFEIGKRHVQRLVTEPDSNCVPRNAFFVQRISVGLAEAVKLRAFDTEELRTLRVTAFRLSAKGRSQCSAMLLQRHSATLPLLPRWRLERQGLP